MAPYYVVQRSQADAQPDVQTGRPLKERVFEMVIDETITPHGGLVLDTSGYVDHEFTKIGRVERDEQGRQFRRLLTPEEACEEAAKTIVGPHVGWTYYRVETEDEVPRGRRPPKAAEAGQAARQRQLQEISGEMAAAKRKIVRFDPEQVPIDAVSGELKGLAEQKIQAAAVQAEQEAAAKSEGQPQRENLAF